MVNSYKTYLKKKQQNIKWLHNTRIQDSGRPDIQNWIQKALFTSSTQTSDSNANVYIINSKDVILKML